MNDLLAPIDWAGRWRALVTGREAQRAARAAEDTARADRDRWTGRADRFAAYSQRLPDDDPVLERLRAALRPDDTVLDIGAGAGRYALPLARLARWVTAVEPSAALRAQLAARIAAEGAENITVVPAAWPDAAVAPADVVVCAHVLYGVVEIAPFLRALDAHTRRFCLVTIRVDQHPGLAELSRALYGEERVPQPAFLDLYNALAGLGIVADVQIIPAGGGFRYDTPEAAAAHYRDRLRIAAGSAPDARLRALIAERLVRDAEGRWRWPGPDPRTALVSWTKGA